MIKGSAEYDCFVAFHMALSLNNALQSGFLVVETLESKFELRRMREEAAAPLIRELIEDSRTEV